MRALLLLLSLCCLAPVSWAAVCNIDGGSRQQIIDGFGFSTAWSGKLSDAKNNALYNTLGMSLLRIRFDENGNFNDERDNTRAAHAAGARVFGSAWTAPPKWNSNGQSNKGYLLTQYYPDFARWLADAVRTVGVDMVSFINEPDFGGANGDSMSEPNMRSFLKTYGKQLVKPILYPEAFQFDDRMSDPALNDPEAAALISVVAGHIYGGGNRVHQNALNKGKHVWQTEHYVTGPNDVGVCMDLVKQVSQLMNNQFSAYCWWWVSDYNAPNENLVKQSGEINLNGYVLGQFAKFVRPGYQRIGSTFSPANNLFITAYVGAEFVVVAVNTGGSVSQSFAVKGVANMSSTLTVHRTDAGARLSNVGTVSVNANGEFTLNLPGNSITTIHGPISGTWVPPPPGTGTIDCDSVSEGSSLTLSCADKQTIASVDFASYGTPSGDCSQGFTKSSCDANTTKALLVAQCVGKSSCVVSASNDVFGDPCPTIVKRLSVKATCSAAPLPSDVTCATANENDNLLLGCSGAKKMTAVTFASYGTPDGACPSPAVNSKCHASKSQSVVEAACVGKQSCTVAATNDLFTDPCSGTIKKLTAAVTCA